MFDIFKVDVMKKKLSFIFVLAGFLLISCSDDDGQDKGEWIQNPSFNPIQGKWIADDLYHLTEYTYDFKEGSYDMREIGTINPDGFFILIDDLTCWYRMLSYSYSINEESIKVSTTGGELIYYYKIEGEYLLKSRDKINWRKYRRYDI